MARKAPRGAHHGAQEKNGVVRADSEAFLKKHSHPDRSAAKWRDLLPCANALQKHPLISNSTCHVLAIEIFQQRDGILTADPGEVLEAGDVNVRRF